MTFKPGEPRKLTTIWKDKIQKYGEGKENEEGGKEVEAEDGEKRRSLVEDEIWLQLFFEDAEGGSFLFFVS